MDKIAQYQQVLFDLDKKGQIPLWCDGISDAKLVDIVLASAADTKDQQDLRSLAAAAIDTYCKRRPITVHTLLHAQTEVEKSMEGRAFLALDSSVTAFACQTVALVSAAAGAYELALAFFAAGAYKVYDVIRLSRISYDG